MIMSKNKPGNDHAKNDHTHMLLFLCITCSAKEVTSSGAPGAEGLIAKGHEGA